MSLGEIPIGEKLTCVMCGDDHEEDILLAIVHGRRVQGICLKHLFTEGNVHLVREAWKGGY